MADELTVESSTIVVHQALHGYGDGHRLLASSLPLKGRDANRLLVMSDASGPNSGIQGNGYLTGYPLHESGRYALARTWPATEMPRPGCVWTHTLLVDFADLATVEHFGAVVSRFRRPQIVDLKQYCVPLTIRNESSGRGTQPSELVRLKGLAAILSALYEKPNHKIFAPASNQAIETWILAVWEQQWPRLKRNFRFCTLAFADRSIAGESFDLQILSGSDWNRYRRVAQDGYLVDPDANDPTLPLSPWLKVALEDLSHERSPDSLRLFLRRAGAEVSTGRSAFAPLCELYVLLTKSGDDATSLDQAVAIADEQLNENEADAARTMIARRVLEKVDEVDIRALHFLLHNLTRIDSASLDRMTLAVGNAVWSRSRSDFWPLLDAKEPYRSVAERFLRSLPAQEVIEAAAKDADSLTRAIRLRPDVIADPLFWRIPAVPLDLAIAQFTSNPQLAQDAISAMIQSELALAPTAVRLAGYANVLPAVARHLDLAESERLTLTEVDWIRAAVQDVEVLASSLATKTIGRKTTLLAIAHATYPDAVPNEIGEDPWLVALRHADGRISQGGRTYLAAYALSRALGSRSRSSAELMALVFDDLYSAAAESRLAQDSWQLVEYRLPWSILWFDWDKCQRLRAAVARAFSDRGLPVDLFVRLTVDDGAFRAIARTMSGSYRGRKYLREVKKALNKAEDSFCANRCRIVDEVL